MKNKTTSKILAIVFFIMLLPLLAIEIIIKCVNYFVEKITLTFQLFLFLADLKK